MSISYEGCSSDPAPGAGSFSAAFFDGVSSTRHDVRLRVAGRQIVLDRADGPITLPASDARLTRSSCNSPWLLSFADGSYCELRDGHEALAPLRQAGVVSVQMPGFVSMLERDWRLVALSIAFLATAVLVFYVWLLPKLAEAGTQMMPASMDARLGRAVFAELEGRMLQPSGLDMDQRDKIDWRFRELLGSESGQYTLFIRHSSAGPNAFALPGKTVVLTDELVTLVDGDLDAITGVLAHELGHLESHHALRSVIQTSALSILGAALIGDYSSLLAAVPVTLGQLRYSRAFEADADSYAHTLLCTRKIDSARTALFFDRIAVKSGNLAELVPDYLRTHAASRQRAEFFRSACP
jgi:Zn-dependent protease with chaperone function